MVEIHGVGAQVLLVLKVTMVLVFGGIATWCGILYSESVLLRMVTVGTDGLWTVIRLLLNCGEPMVTAQDGENWWYYRFLMVKVRCCWRFSPSWCEGFASMVGVGEGMKVYPMVRFYFDLLVAYAGLGDDLGW
ncbi:hypothetical protein ADUPG1_006595 [Aduncisulcus paluster]|uniref:Uncharacterized protein n=1 Tax=Aduncisulcus paluster TaxID=2918883 RepID=A0ABQ5KIU1_9EUKA|nr:hypothetical protein ADUPG1_006595 [Aduncisulcus paluster]